MDPKTKARIQKTKSYIATHASHIVMAGSAVAGVVILSKQLKLQQKEDLVKNRASAAIGQCIEEGRKFDYYPGLGVHVYAVENAPIEQ